MRAPKMLQEIQNWFGKTISIPLQHDHKLPNENLAAEKYILPSPTLNPHARIELYHQQYWWRLLSCLQENFPMVTRLFGYDDFNQKIAIPYLSAHPPSHWGLNRLGESLPQWIRANYHAKDRDLIVQAAEIDWAAKKAFWIKSLPPPLWETLSEEKIATTPLRLQPHVSLFSFESDLFHFRTAFLEHDVSYYDHHPFPPLDHRKSHFVLYRHTRNHVHFKEITEAAYTLLQAFAKRASLQEACTHLEGKPHLEKQAEGEIPLWFKEWSSQNWFWIAG
ncbi:MAG: hypothetical protein K940chlam9_00228 [Chlamydiae bacterium]|nr:hypothetical protein [Chlamydiota bacterium]